MTDWSRVADYIYDYFPDPIYSPKDVENWIKENIPQMNKKSRDIVISDWEAFVSPAKVEQIEALKEDIEVLEKEIPTEHVGRWSRVKRWLGRLFGRY